MARVVLVTGVARSLGARFAQLMSAQPGVAKVVGVDVVAPEQDLGDTEFVRVDIRHPVIAKVIARHRVDTVVHMNVIATPASAGGRATMKEINVIGTMQLLAACQQARSVRKLVVKSSTVVYGSSPRDPVMFSEDSEPAAIPRAGFGRDSVEVEGYVRGFARRRPDVDVTVLRFANFLGPRIQTPMTAYFQLPVIPTVLGFDARMQFVHEDDGLEALRRVSVADLPGTYNIAGEGVLMLSQAVRRLGRPTLPVPAPSAAVFGAVARRLRLADFSPEQLHFLSYGRVVDTSLARRSIGFRPRFSSAATFDDFVAARGLRPLVSPERIRSIERHLLDVLPGGGDGSG